MHAIILNCKTLILSDEMLKYDDWTNYEGANDVCMWYLSTSRDDVNFSPISLMYSVRVKTHFQLNSWFSTKHRWIDFILKRIINQSLRKQMCVCVTRTHIATLVCRDLEITKVSIPGNANGQLDKLPVNSRDLLFVPDVCLMVWYWPINHTVWRWLHATPCVADPESRPITRGIARCQWRSLISN